MAVPAHLAHFFIYDDVRQERSSVSRNSIYSRKIFQFNTMKSDPSSVVALVDYEYEAPDATINNQVRN